MLQDAAQRTVAACSRRAGGNGFPNQVLGGLNVWGCDVQLLRVVIGWDRDECHVGPAGDSGYGGAAFESELHLPAQQRLQVRWRRQVEHLSFDAVLLE